MYTSKLISVIADIDNPNVSVSTIEFYKDGTLLLTVSERGFSSLEQVKHYVKDKINHLSEQEAIDSFIANPPLGDIDLTVTVTPEEQATQDEQKKIRDLVLLKQKLDIKLIDQTAYDIAVTTVKSADIEIKQ